MKYGYFDDEKREYVITDPKTPYPWINYLGTERFFSLVSNGSGGYSFYRDALLRRITRYRYNNVPLDSGGKYFYIKDGDDIWNPGWRPTMNNLDMYQCRHGMGYTKITGERDGIRASTLFLVPPGFDGEVQKLTVKNTGSAHKTVTAFAYLEWCLWHAYHDMTNFQRNFSTGQVEVESNVIYHKTEYRERRNHYAFYSCSEKPTGFDSDRESFVGTYNGYDKPQAVVDGACKNSIADGWAPVGAYQFDIDLPPGMEKEIVFVLGYVENAADNKWIGKQTIDKSKAKKMIGQYGTVDGVEAGLRELSVSWSNILSTFSVTTPDEHVNRMVNIWNPYQCMVTYNMGRSASYFESGIGRGLGFRDTNQDLLGCIHQIPERARERILDVAATQFEDGSAYHQYQPLTKRGNFEVGGDFNDDPLWLILSTAAYIRETGDWSILDEQVPFDNDESNAKPLFKHLEQSFRHVINNLGPHDLPLIGRADWNDCLNLNCFSEDPDDSFQTVTNKDGKIAESVMIAGLFVYAGREFAELCDRTDKAHLAVEVRQRVDEMAEAVCKYGWDGSWYLRAYDDFGNKLGSDELDEGKIFIESQGWCAMAGIGQDKDYPTRALDSVKANLDSDFGIVMQQPAFSEYYLHLGEISSYPEGYKENAGIFCHNNPWIIIAEAMADRTDDAFEHYTKICPSYLEDVSDVHRTEPYVYAQMIAGKDAPRHGEAKNSWLTGTAAWNYVAITQWILGIRPSLDGLIIDPKIPGSWGGFSMFRRFRDNEYNITISDPDHAGYGVKSMTIDGTPISGNVIPVAAGTGSHDVVVVLGG